MGTHPIFESDFDCLTDKNRTNMTERICLWAFSILYLATLVKSQQMCDDEDLDCFEGSADESSGDYSYSDNGSNWDLEKTPRNDGENEDSSPNVIDLFTGRKFLAAVVSGSCVGLLLASMAMMLVLCKARRDNTLRRYNYQAGNKNEIFA